jgi:signal transduction histidine kinase
VVRDFSDVPDIDVDRHKLLQIVMNLLSNARHAVESTDGERRITIRLRTVGERQVAIDVEDNGVGIPAENLNKIFNHGFTTKRDGHGFGLHSCACAVIEIGGTLSVASEGVGRGASFTVVVPVAPPGNKTMAA